MIILYCYGQQIKKKKNFKKQNLILMPKIKTQNDEMTK